MEEAISDMTAPRPYISIRMSGFISYTGGHLKLREVCGRTARKNANDGKWTPGTCRNGESASISQLSDPALRDSALGPQELEGSSSNTILVLL